MIGDVNEPLLVQEVAPRDGLQIEPRWVETEDKIALIDALGQLGGIVSPVMVGRIKDLMGSSTPALYVIAAMTLLCALLLGFALPDKLRAKEAASH